MKLKKLINLSIVHLLLLTGASFAASIKKNEIKLIKLAEKQKILTERISKDYLYIGNHVATGKALKEIKLSVKLLGANHKKMQSSINDEEIINLLSFVEMSSSELQDIMSEKYSLDNAKLVMDLSESMLEGSDYVANALKDKVKVKDSGAIVLASNQIALAQRIAKYYIAYQSGIKDKNTVDQMKDAVSRFNNIHKKLMKNKSNTVDINRRLNAINKLWKIVYKFYLNIEKGGLPLIVYTTTDKISKQMEIVTNLYVKIHK